MSNTVVHVDIVNCLAGLNELRPDLELLRWLARGSLKQNLLRSIRLWVWLCWLYRDDQTLRDPFTLANCRALFFSASHPKGDQVPTLHDSRCSCAKTAAQWLFNAQTGLSQQEWQQDFQHYEAIPKSNLNHLLNNRLFAVTRRSLATDLQELAQLGWLQYSEQERHYRRTTQFPSYPGGKQLGKLPAAQAIDLLQFLQPDLGAIAQNHASNVRGIQRFFLHLDYITPLHKLDQVDDWQEELRKVWQQDPVPPLYLVYQSARHQSTLTPIIYPVSIYYAQRSVYLCGFNPELTHQWYNFRLDRIQSCCSLEWTDTRIPQGLRLCYQQGKLPDPSYIQMELDKAWGFDFYLPPQRMVLRFDRDFHDHYIANTFRHSTFEAINWLRVMQLSQQHQDIIHREKLLQVLKMRSPQDAYYQVYYRDEDTNIQHRLRAWRPHVEVLLPLHLREKIAQEVQKEFQLYY